MNEGEFLLPLLVVLVLLAERFFQLVDFGLRNQRQFDIFGAREHAGQRIVIDGRDRIVLVVVAAGTGDGQPQKSAGERVDPVSNLVHAVAIAVINGAAGEIAQGGQVLVGGRLIGLRRIVQISRDLPADELVVRQVAIEGIDYPVTVAVAVGILAGFERVRLVLAVAGHVEPEPRHPLAVVRRIEQSIDQGGVGGPLSLPRTLVLSHCVRV
jgi:hypothetical protein